MYVSDSESFYWLELIFVCNNNNNSIIIFVIFFIIIIHNTKQYKNNSNNNYDWVWGPRRFMFFNTYSSSRGVCMDVRMLLCLSSLFIGDLRRLSARKTTQGRE